MIPNKHFFYYFLDWLYEIHVCTGTKLKDASDQQAFNRNIEDVEVWLAEIEGTLMSEDYGKVRAAWFSLWMAITAEALIEPIEWSDCSVL